MSPKPNPVPSRDALRALRNLALSPYAAAFGTIGSACSLAAVHYHSCRSLRVVEQVVETKRTLNTISNGRGIRQLNRMIEAAEKGDDFTLHHGRPMRPQKRRSSTAIAVDDTTASDPYIPPEQPTRVNDRSQSPTKYPESSQAGRAPYQQTRSRSSVPATRAIRSIDHLKGGSFTPENYREAAVQAIKSRQEQKWRMMMRIKPRQDKPLDSSIQPGVVQEVSDLHPVPARDSVLDKSGLIQLPSLATEESIFFNFVFGKESQDDVFNSNVFQSMHPWRNTSEAKGTEKVQQLPSSTAPRADFQASNSINEIPTIVDTPPSIPYLAPNTPVLDQVVSHSMVSKYNTTLHEQSLRLAHAGEPRYRYLFNLIAQDFHDLGDARAYESWEETLTVYAASNRADDFVLVKLLYTEFVDKFEFKRVQNTIKRVVRAALQGSETNLQYVSLLYPSQAEKPKTLTKFASYLPMQYMEDFCKANANPDDQITEALKLVKGTRLCRIEPHEQLLLPVLRSLCARGQVKEAQALVDEGRQAHQIHTTLYTEVELMRGYASIGNWWKVKTILQQSHADQLSWQKIHGFAGLFVRSLDEHMAVHPLETSCEFVMHAIKHTGLFPTGLISTRVILGCIRQKRYDLLRQYLNMVQRDFPFLETGTKTATFASALAAVWKDTGASCDDILEGCKAIAFNAIRDPFSGALRGVISEAVARDLNARIKALEDRGIFKVPTLGQYPGVSAYAESIRELVRHHHKIGFSDTTRGLAGDLVKQTKLMLQLEELFNGSYVADRAAKPVVEKVEPSSTTKPVKVVVESLPRMSPGLRALRLPGAKDIVIMLQKFYDSRHARGLPIDHTAISYVCNRLTRQGRDADAYTVMEAAFHSRWVQPPNGKPFNLELLLQWLRLAFQIRSGGKVRDVLWAAVQAGPEVTLTNEFLLLAKVSLPRTHFHAHKRARNNAIDEAEYLHWRLRWRRAQELNKKETGSPMFGEWQKMGRP